jgi:Cell division protein FtsI/penicillin-binding protein 2
LNSKIQQYAEILAQETAEKYEPKNLQILVMNAKTGAIEAATQRQPLTQRLVRDYRIVGVILW